MAKLHATLTKANGKTVKISDNTDIVANFYKGNKVLYSVRISYQNVGDLEEPIMDAIITSHDYRGELERYCEEHHNILLKLLPNKQWYCSECKK